MSKREDTEISFSLDDIPLSSTPSQHSDTVSVEFGISSEILSSVISNEPLNDSMRQYEEYIEEASVNSTAEKTNSSNHWNSTFISESSVKRYKSNSSAVSGENDTQIFSGFKTGGNKKIYVDNQRLHEAVEREKNPEDFIADNSIVEMNAPEENPDARVTTGFTTGNKKPVLVSRTSIENDPAGLLASDLIAKAVNEPHMVNTGFTNGKNKTVMINESGLNKMAVVGGKRAGEKGFDRIVDNFDCAHSEDEELEKIEEVYKFVRKHFKKEEDGWIFEHFKWSWMHLYLNDQIDGDTVNDISANIIEIMELKRKHERSILRRIVEFDDAPFRHMILGVIDYTSEYIELFDGFYSLKFAIDANIYTFLKRHCCTLGSKLHVFGCDLLIKQATSIFEIEGIPLKIFYNSVKCARGDAKMGRSNNISFLNTISVVRPDGGMVSGLIVKINQIVERKYRISVESYKKNVDINELEKELENIYEMAERAGRKIESHEIVTAQYLKIVVDDGTGSCLLTWWDPPEVRAGERYMFVSLSVTGWNGRMELVATKKTYYELIK